MRRGDRARRGACRRTCGTALRPESLPELSLGPGELWAEINAGEFGLVVEDEDYLERFGDEGASGNVPFHGHDGVFIAVIVSGENRHVFVEARVLDALGVEEAIHGFGRVAGLNVLVDKALNRLDSPGGGIESEKSKRPPIPMRPT
jgi:hypothetical protein